MQKVKLYNLITVRCGKNCLLLSSSHLDKVALHVHLDLPLRQLQLHGGPIVGSTETHRPTGIETVRLSLARSTTAVEVLHQEASFQAFKAVVGEVKT